MIMMSEDRAAQSDERLLLKTQDQTLIRKAMDGAGLTRWEAQVLPRVVEEVYFATPGGRPLQEGQVRYQCVAVTAGAGKAISECAQVSVALTLFRLDEDRPCLHDHGAAGLRRSKLCRLTEEAREQGGLLTQEDLAVLLSCDERTVRRDVAALKKIGINVATRGFVKDIGPTVSHKAQAIRHWLAGKEPVAVGRAINHSTKAVERYLEDFKRVAFLTIKGFDEVTIARAAHLSPALVRTYRAVHEEVKDRPEFAHRYQEMLIALESSKTSQPDKAAVKKGATKRKKTNSPSIARVSP